MILPRKISKERGETAPHQLIECTLAVPGSQPDPDISSRLVPGGAYCEMSQGRSYACQFLQQEDNHRWEQKAMHSLLTLLFGAVLAILAYGLSFFPSATLRQINEVEEAINWADDNGANPDANDSQAPSTDVQG